MPDIKKSQLNRFRIKPSSYSLYDLLFVFPDEYFLYQPQRSTKFTAACARYIFRLHLQKLIFVKIVTL